MKQHFFLAVLFALMSLLAACGNPTLQDTDVVGMEDFIDGQETGFVLYDSSRGDGANREQAEKALKSNEQQALYFDYDKHVKNEASRTFRDDIGSKQLTDTLGYYENGILLVEFEFPNHWTTESVEQLNHFIDQISG